MKSLTRQARVMNMLKDSSEVREARELLLQIMGAPASSSIAGSGAASQKQMPSSSVLPVASVAAPPLPAADAQAAVTAVAPPAPPVARRPESQAARHEPAGAAAVEQWVAQPASAGDERAAPVSASGKWSRGDRLQNILALLCEREGFTGALVTDNSGLPLAASSSAAASENLAAFSTVLGDALVKASSYLGQDDATDVSLDINARQKIVLRRFDLEGRPCYLLVLCAASCEPRRAMGAAIPGIVSTLAVS